MRPAGADSDIPDKPQSLAITRESEKASKKLKSWITGQKRQAGRPTKLTPEMALEIVRNVERCGKLMPAFEACGVGWNRVADWRRYARKGTEPYKMLFEAVDMAKGQWAIDRVESIQASDDYHAHAWLLERLSMDDFSKPAEKLEAKHSHEMLPTIDVESDAVAAAEAAVLAEVGGTNGIRDASPVQAEAGPDDHDGW